MLYIAVVRRNRNFNINSDDNLKEYQLNKLSHILNILYKRAFFVIKKNQFFFMTFRKLFKKLIKTSNSSFK